MKIKSMKDILSENTMIKISQAQTKTLKDIAKLTLFKDKNKLISKQTPGRSFNEKTLSALQQNNLIIYKIGSGYSLSKKGFDFLKTTLTTNEFNDLLNK